MEYDAKILLQRIDDYFTGIISKTDLGKWANKAYYDILKGGYVENEKIVIYPFVKVISTFHIRENDIEDIYPCTEENVAIIKDILHGKRNYDFAVEMSVPIQIYSMFKEKPYFDIGRREIFLKLRNIISEYFEKRYEYSDEMDAMIEKAICLKHRNETVLDFLEECICRYLTVLFKNASAELGLQENMKLYAQKSEKNIMGKRLISYLDSYIGNSNFQLLIAYREGKPNIIIDV